MQNVHKINLHTFLLTSILRILRGAQEKDEGVYW